MVLLDEDLVPDYTVTVSLIVGVACSTCMGGAVHTNLSLADVLRRCVGGQ